LFWGIQKKTGVEMLAALRAATAVGPLFVGVFSDQTPEEVLRITEEAELVGSWFRVEGMGVGVGV